jgi:tetratricopeptide (TPR) repeat protein
MTLAAYAPCFRYPFIHFDDPDYVTENAHVQAGLTADSVRWAFTTFACGNWHPLTWLSLQLDRTLYGPNAGGFHLTNVLLHAASTVLLFLVLSSMTGLFWRSGFVAALFALHPLNVEPVAWVAERKGVLSTFFWMLTLAAYLYYVRRPSVGRYAVVLLALVLGLMAKSMLVTLPLVLLLLDYWPLERLRFVGQDSHPVGGASTGSESYPTILEKLPLVAVVLAWCVIAYIAQHRIGALPSFDRYPATARIWNALSSYAGYLGKMFWPLDLAAYYPHPGAAVSAAGAGVAGLLLLAVSVLVLGPGHRRKYLSMGWFWYLLTLVPVIGLVQIGAHGMADRYTYVPLVGLFILVTWGAVDLAVAWGLPRPALAMVGGGVLLVCLALTRIQVEYWSGDRELWEHALAVTSNNAMAHNNLGRHFLRQGSPRRAAREFEQAVTIEPNLALFHKNFATQLRAAGQTDGAIRECRKAVELEPGEAEHHFLLGNLLRDQGQDEEALTELQTAVQLEPDSALSHANFANALLDLARPAEAEAEYAQAMALDPEYAFPHVGLGKMLADEERFEQAAAEFRRAVALAPDDAVAHFQLAMTLEALGNLDDALGEFGKAANLGLGQAGRPLRACKRLQAFRVRLPALLAGRDQPSDNAERLGFAHLCGQPFVARYALAAGLYSEAFRVDPGWKDSLGAVDRVDAAVTAARAGCGQGQDADSLTVTDKTQLREQARTWLDAELALWTTRGQSVPAQARVIILRSWLRHAGLDAVRDPAALARLPRAERQAWQKLWQAIERERARASAPPKD